MGAREAFSWAGNSCPRRARMVQRCGMHRRLLVSQHFCEIVGSCAAWSLWWIRLLSEVLRALLIFTCRLKSWRVTYPCEWTSVKCEFWRTFTCASTSIETPPGARYRVESAPQKAPMPPPPSRKSPMLHLPERWWRFCLCQYRWILPDFYLRVSGFPQQRDSTERPITERLILSVNTVFSVNVGAVLYGGRAFIIKWTCNISQFYFKLLINILWYKKCFIVTWKHSFILMMMIEPCFVNIIMHISECFGKLFRENTTLLNVTSGQTGEACVSCTCKYMFLL